MVKDFQIKLINCLMLIPLYYIVGSANIYLYVLSLALYNIFLACFKTITITDKINKYQDTYTKYKIFKVTILVISVISMIFLLLSIVISDVIGNLLKINNSFITFFMMGISIMGKPITKISLEYIECLNYKKLNKALYIIYNYLEMGLLLLIALLVFKNNNIDVDTANGLLYLSKIISAILVNVIIYMIVIRKRKLAKNRESKQVDYKIEIKQIFNRNNIKRVVVISEKIYYYFSIILLYLMLLKRYSYMIEDIVAIVIFLYFYFLSLVNILGEILMRKSEKINHILDKIYWIFDNYLSISIILIIMSSLICRVVFNNLEMGIYLIMAVCLGMFITLYKISFRELGNHRLGYISLGLGLILKCILMIPLVDSVYRMGYNLVYGDILSTIIGMGTSVIINYIYLKNKENKNKIFEKLLRSMYVNIILCIFLVVMQFIIPIKTDSYIKSLLLLIIYGMVSVILLKLKRKKRV